jgi:hypothetical protein
MINEFTRMQQLAGLLTEINIHPKNVWQVAPDDIKRLLRWVVAYYSDHYDEDWSPIQNRRDGTLSLKIDFDDLTNLNGEPGIDNTDENPYQPFDDDQMEKLRKLTGKNYLYQPHHKYEGVYASKASIDKSSLTVYYGGINNGFDKNGNLVKFVNEVNIEPASHPEIFRAVPDMDLYKVKDFPRITKKDDPLHQKNIYNVLSIIYLDLYKEEIDDDFEIYDDTNADLLKLTSLEKVYVYGTGDGYLYILSNLSNFSEGYRTEEDWGIEGWEKIG